VFYDDVQYDKGGWRNRNRVKTSLGTRWLTIPVCSKDSVVNQTAINEIYICWDRSWNKKHWTTLKQAYGKAPYFQQYVPMLEEFYNRRPQLLADFTIDLTIALAKGLGIKKKRFLRSSSLGITGIKTDRIINILKELGATHYITGPSAKSYLEENKFYSAGISLEYMIYDYPEYKQLYPPFESQVSILDLLFMTGDQASKYIW
jgi:hypothetical protein